MFVCVSVWSCILCNCFFFFHLFFSLRKLLCWLNIQRVVIFLLLLLLFLLFVLSCPSIGQYTNKWIDKLEKKICILAFAVTTTITTTTTSTIIMLKKMCLLLLLLVCFDLSIATCFRYAGAFQMQFYVRVL